MPSARYALAILGFTCHNETVDDALERDGKHDEVYFKHLVRRYDGITGTPLSADFAEVTSKTMGDTNGFPDRVKAGSAWGGRGGIIAGNSFPDPIPFKISVDALNDGLSPPYKIWEADLAQGTGDTYMVTVTLWEWDDNQNIAADVTNWFKTIDNTYGQKAKEVFSKIYPPNGVIFDAVSLIIQTLDTGVALFGNPESRPIGLLPAVNGKAEWNANAPIILPMTYENAEMICQSNITGLGLGIIVRDFVDHKDLKGNYSVYMKCYKVTQYSDAEGDLAVSSTTFTIDASDPKFQADGGATLSAFIATGSSSEDILATVVGWKPGGGQHPTSILAKRATEGNKKGIWFRLNFVGDVANGVVSICFYQGGNPAWNTMPTQTAITWNAAPWH